ncbi:uncharacterized protein ACO6RY_03061 [Pungitius sinensis]
MWVNSSSFDGLPLLPPALPSNSTFHLLSSQCFRSRTSVYVFCAVSSVYALLLPLLVRVVHTGYQQYRKQGSVSMAATSPSAMFTYHSIVMQLNEMLGFFISFWGSYMDVRDVHLAGTFVWAANSFGQGMFQVLLCVERYVAVVHPVTYLGRRQAPGVRRRDASIACVWLLCLGCPASLSAASVRAKLVFYFCAGAVFLLVLCVCSIWVLAALARPTPGKVGGRRKLVDQSKRRAFLTILAVMGVLLLRFGGNLLSVVVYNVVPGGCVTLLLTSCFSHPGTLMTCLLFLQQEGKKSG